MTADFDDHAATYQDEVSDAVSFTGREVDFYAGLKTERLLEAMVRHGIDPATARLLDVGCGVGVADAHLVGRVGSLEGVDTSSETVARAAEANPTVRYTAYDGGALPYDDESFDVAFAICVVHHVEVEGRPGFFDEMRRVVRPGGLVVVFEHNPWNPLTRVVVSRCEFDVGVVLAGRAALKRLADGADLEPVEHRFITFAPVDGAWGRRLDRAFGRVPLGAQHVMVGRRA